MNIVRILVVVAALLAIHFSISHLSDPDSLTVWICVIVICFAVCTILIALKPAFKKIFKP